MVDISRHPILQQASDVCYAIEKCGASVELTNAVTKASDLVRAIDKFMDEHGIAVKKDPVGGHASHAWYHDSKYGGRICQNCGVAGGTTKAQRECK